MANTTWNPSDKTASLALSNLNLTATASANSQGVRSVDRQVSGKYYWEYTATTIIGAYLGLGTATSALGNLIAVGVRGTAAVNNVGSLVIDGVATGIGFGTINNGNIVCIAVDLTARLIWFRIGAAGNWNMSAPANPATAVGGVAITSGMGIPAYPQLSMANSEVITANFGDTAFTGTVPSGFTSGFTAGAAINTNALATQVAVEHWLSTNPDAQITQVLVEHWASVPTTTVQALATSVVLEQWASVASIGDVVPQNRVMVMA